jgi:hypothetical protein
VRIDLCNGAGWNERTVLAHAAASSFLRFWTIAQTVTRGICRETLKSFVGNHRKTTGKTFSFVLTPLFNYTSAAYISSTSKHHTPQRLTLSFQLLLLMRASIGSVGNKDNKALIIAAAAA